MKLDDSSDTRRNFLTYLVSSLLVVLLALSLADNAFAESAGADEFVGSWKLYKDDDKPGDTVHQEVMNFWPDGKFSIVSDPDYVGLYRVDGNKLELLVKLEEKALPIAREFKFTSKGLQFKNDKKGWVYYIRISDTPGGRKPKL